MLNNQNAITEQETALQNNMEAEPVYINCREVMRITGLSRGKAYELIRQCNKELAAAGKFIRRGMVNRHYLNKKL
ncbi:MAG: hypothetical protein Q4E64_00105 [Phascolarctobacterium sp.]|uniref:hypothetical protein n=1 Tax=Phascolarctobacterium sp. TaxID=2049039 RepID=UPI0026DCB5FD|nr:hypothetical protein [Phascolarctobacterium sp.]MDO4920224.1 hypothetical protein [Phascolarctobacterium sp.]